VESDEEQPQRPTAVLFVYSWDLLLAILALFGVLAPFAGGLVVSGQPVSLPLAVQIVAALSSAAYAAVLIIVASLLTRRRRWVRNIQIITLVVAVALAGISVVVQQVTGAHVELGSILVTLLFALVDLLVIVLMTERRVVTWYVEPGAAPRYATGALAFWALTGCALVITEAVIR